MPFVRRMPLLFVALVWFVVPAPTAADTILKALFSDFEGRTYTTVHFEFDKAHIDGTARPKIRKQAEKIMKRPNTLFAVTGHTDLVGSPAYNKALGLRRARRVVSELVALGVDPRQLRAMVSQGESDPAVNTADRERRNRRVVTTIIGPRNPLVKPLIPGKSHQVAGLAPQTEAAPPSDSSAPPRPSQTTPPMCPMIRHLHRTLNPNLTRQATGRRQGRGPEIRASEPGSRTQAAATGTNLQAIRRVRSGTIRAVTKCRTKAKSL